MSSPRPWRCFSKKPLKIGTKSVFSTSVEVFLVKYSKLIVKICLLHVRGGVSIDRAVVNPELSVFSTSVEVFP